MCQRYHLRAVLFFEPQRRRLVSRHINRIAGQIINYGNRIRQKRIAMREIVNLE